MNRRVEAQPRRLGPDDLATLALEPRVLEHDLGEQFHDRAVERRIRLDLDNGPSVVRLQVEHTHATGGGEPLHEGPLPLVVWVELQLELRCRLEPREGIAARGHDEAHRPVLTSERVAEVRAVLPERQVEGRAFERPAPVVRGRFHLRLAGEEDELVEPPREVREARRARRVDGREPFVILRGVRHIFAAPLLPAAAEHDSRCHAGELCRDLDRAPLGLERIDDELEIAQQVPAGHQPTVGSTLPLGSTRIMRATSGIAARIGIPQTGQRIW